MLERISDLESRVAAASPAPTSILGQSRDNPAPVGVSVLVTPSTNARDFFYLRITVMTVLRGNDAYLRLVLREPSNPPPPAGYVYVLAFISFEYIANSLSSGGAYNLSRQEFIAISGDERNQSTQSSGEAIVTLPVPALAPTTATVGATRFGWVLFLAPMTDASPLLTFRATNTQNDMGWWKFY